MPITHAFEDYLQLSSSEVAQANKVSSRKFQRDFKAEVGLSFEAYKQMVKFQVAVQQLQHGKEEKLVELAYALNYSDQAHFGRSFKHYSGFTPKEFLQRPLQYNEREVIRLNRLRIISN